MFSSDNLAPQSVSVGKNNSDQWESFLLSTMLLMLLCDLTMLDLDLKKLKLIIPEPAKFRYINSISRKGINEGDAFPPNLLRITDSSNVVDGIDWIHPKSDLKWDGYFRSHLGLSFLKVIE